jgi:PIN domain nuclease of toxin-antitoxin system
MTYEPALVLDTCALLWLVSGSDNLSANALLQIENASIVYVSSISAWEISLKFFKKQLILPMEPEEWFRHVIDKHSLVIYPLDISLMFKANTLPFHHRDPVDRFIIATAIKENAAVVTGDNMFLKYDIRVIK